MDKYSIGEVVTVVVTGIAPYGIFVQMPDGSQGLIHISEISDGFVKNCANYANVNSTIDAMIIGYGDKNNYKLSIKRRKRARQTLKGAIKPPSGKENNKEKLDSIPFEPLKNALDSQIQEEYHRMLEDNK